MSRIRQNKKKSNKRRHHAHAAEDDEPSKKRKRIYHHPRGKHFHKNNTRKDLSKIRCCTCDEVGNFCKKLS